jgi:hypothetical protein
MQTPLWLLLVEVIFATVFANIITLPFYVYFIMNKQNWDKKEGETDEQAYYRFERKKWISDKVIALLLFLVFTIITISISECIF